VRHGDAEEARVLARRQRPPADVLIVAQRRGDVGRQRQVGEFIEVDDLTGDRLDGLIQKVLSTPTYHENAQRFKNIIAQRRGLDVAVEVIERALQAALGKSIKAPILSSLTVRETA